VDPVDFRTVTERTQSPGGVSPSGVAAATAAVIGFFVAAVFPRATWPLIDGDVWWHIRAGEEVLQTGSVPRTDTWSIVGQGMRWISQDWLSNVLLALGYRLGELGPTVLSLARAAAAMTAQASDRTVGPSSPSR
jgi:hypothetical protein